MDEIDQLNQEDYAMLLAYGDDIFDMDKLLDQAHEEMWKV